MSFNPCQFGEGFDVATKPIEATKFIALATRKGLEATLTIRTIATYDDYNQPDTWDETEFAIKVFEHKRGTNLPITAGNVMQADGRFLTSICHSIGTNDLIAVQGITYEIDAVLEKRAYLEIYGVRKVDG